MIQIVGNFLKHFLIIGIGGGSSSIVAVVRISNFLTVLECVIIFCPPYPADKFILRFGASFDVMAIMNLHVDLHIMHTNHYPILLPVLLS